MERAMESGQGATQAKACYLHDDENLEAISQSRGEGRR